MPKFKKMVVSEGVYYPYNPKTMKKEKVVVSKQDLEEIVSSFSKMKDKGLKIPAPWKHDFDITTFTKIEEGSSGILEDSSKNAGFWDSLEGAINPKTNKFEVWGEVDVPGDADDANTPAGKVGTSVRDTSIYLRKDFEDGNGNKWDKAIMHIALVTHPIENGQPNFELTDPNDSYLAMSEYEADISITDLANKLKKVCKLYLPPNTSSEDLARNLMMAVEQLALTCDEDGDDDSTDSKRYKAEPIIMSHFTKEQIDSLVATKAVNPKTNKPFAVEDFNEEPAKKEENTKDSLLMSALMNQTQIDRRKSYKTRIDNLVNTGRTPKAYADANLYPKADAYEIEVTETGLKTPMVEELIMSLEQLPQVTPNLDTARTLDGYLGGDTVNEAELDRIADLLVSETYID